jgi:hypothetical protein
MLTRKPLRFTLCVLNKARRGICRESDPGNTKGAADSLNFVQADEITYVVLVRGQIDKGAIKVYEGDAPADTLSANASWTIKGAKPTFPKRPLTTWDW